jgi:hypothetical protein
VVVSEETKFSQDHRLLRPLAEIERECEEKRRIEAMRREGENLTII